MKRLATADGLADKFKSLGSPRLQRHMEQSLQSYIGTVHKETKEIGIDLNAQLRFDQYKSMERPEATQPVVIGSQIKKKPAVHAPCPGEPKAAVANHDGWEVKSYVRSTGGKYYVPSIYGIAWRGVRVCVCVCVCV